MIKGLLSLIGLFVGAAVLLVTLIFLFHRLWVLIKGNREEQPLWARRSAK